MGCKNVNAYLFVKSPDPQGGKRYTFLTFIISVYIAQQAIKSGFGSYSSKLQILVDVNKDAQVKLSQFNIHILFYS